MMDDMVERVARAMAASDEAEPLIGCACLGKEYPEDFACPCKMRAARRRSTAAIEAMREPTEAMMLAFQDDEVFHGNSSFAVEWGKSIDAALKRP